MRFSNPNILFSLLAVSIPILIHLFNLRKYKRVLFSNVQQLKDVQQETIKKQKLKHLLVLLARIFFILFIVFAFAKPYLPVSQNAPKIGYNSVSIYIDNSFTMSLQNENGNILDQAKVKAKEIIAAYQIQDKFQIITNDFSGESQQILTKELAIKAIDDVKISANTRTIDAVISRQNALFSTFTSANKNYFYLSDFQQNVISKNVSQSFDSTIFYRMVVFKPSTIENISIDSVWFESPIHMANQKEKLLVKITNHSNHDWKELPIKLQINKESKALNSISLNKNSTIVDTFIFTNNNEGIQNAKVFLESEQLAFDDQYYFTYTIANALPVLLIDGNKNTTPFIQAVYQTEPLIKLTINQFDQINFSLFNLTETIILNEPVNVSDGLVQALQKFVSNGKSLIIIPSERTNFNSLKQLLNVFQMPNYIGLQSASQNIKSLNFKEKTFEDVFTKFNQEVNLPSIKKHFIWNRNASSSLMNLQDGTSVLQKNKFKKGDVYLFSFSLDPSFGDFAEHPLMVPIFLKTPQLVSSDQPLAYVISGKNLVPLNRIANPLSDQNKYSLSIANQLWIPEWKLINSSVNLVIPIDVNEAGWLSLKNNQQSVASIALNYNRSESALNYITSSELASLNINKLKVYDASIQNLKNSISQDSLGLQLWKICVILALVFLASEVLILRFFSRFNP